MDIEKLKKLVEFKPSGDFGEDFGIVVEVHIKEMNDWLDETDDIITSLLKNIPNQTVADVFSDKLGSILRTQIRSWMLQDDALMEEFEGLSKAYAKKIKSIDADAQIKKKFKELDEDIEALVKKANSYGKSWTDQADSAGLAIDSKFRKPIEWFSKLTVEEIKGNYIRNAKTHIKQI